MTAIARMAVLDLRTVTPYRRQVLAVFAVVLVLLANRPSALVPALVLLVTSTVAAYPFQVADKSGLETLYAVLPLPRRSVLWGHYAWALASFLATVVVGTIEAVISARVQAQGLDQRTILAVAWGLFAVNVAIQFPLLIRFGYTRIGVWGTTLPLTLIVVAVVRWHVALTSLRPWLPLVWPVGAAALVASAVVAVAVDRQRVR
jgi:hypothetical protein